MRVFALCLCLIMASVFGVKAQDNFFPDATYNPAIPTPESYLGHGIGDILVRYDQVIGYLNLLSNASDRVSIQTIGRSHEGRPIVLVIITDPANHARLKEIQAAHVALTDPSQKASPSADMPVVTWLNYGVHGDEISGIEAVLGIAYHMAAVEDEDWRRVLRESVILNIATFNPDGRDRSAMWYNMHHARVPVADKAHREHSIPWPGGRTNHYWFDLNRQWLPLTQPESQAWIQVYHDWKPNVVVDFHEMGSEQTYYFHPGEEGRSHPLLTASSENLLARLARYPARHLDAEGRPYFTGEVFDNYYLGKGSTYPHVTGGVGILFEQSGSEGITIDSGHGPQSYRENIRQHMNSGLSVIRGAHEMKADFLAHQKAFFETALEEARRADVKGYVFSAPGDAKRLEAFLTMLNRHKISTFLLNQDVREDGVTYTAGESYYVPANQPQYRLIRGIFEKLTEFPRESFYDISGWTLPFAYGLNFAPLGKAISGRALGPVWAGPANTVPVLEGAAVAYALDWRGYYAPRGLYRLLDAGVLARATTKAMTIETPDGRINLAPGAIIISPGNNNADVVAKLPQLLSEIAREDGVIIHKVTAGLTPQGPDIGGASQIAMQKPKLLLMTGDGFSPYDVGEMWYLLDHQMETPVTLRDGKDFSSFNLYNYSHLVLADGRPPLNDADIEALKSWVRSGGVLIATQRAAFWAAKNGFGEVAVQEDKEEAEETPERIPFGDKYEREALDRIAGAVFMTDADTTHPVAFGLTSANLPVHRDSEDMFERHTNAYASVAAYKPSPLVSGYASQENQQKMAGTPAIVAESMGEGAVVLFADNPGFRGYWLGTHKLVMNAIYFARGF